MTQDQRRGEAGEGGEEHGSTWVRGTGIFKSLAYAHSLACLDAYLLGGSCFFPLLLALLLAIGSKSLTASSGFAGAFRNDVDSTSWAASDEALRRNRGWMAGTVGLMSLHRAVAVRYGSSRRAMMSDVVLADGYAPNGVRDSRCQLLGLGVCSATRALQG